jgi:hypothetical protein
MVKHLSKPDLLVGGAFLAGGLVFLFQRKLPFLSVWLLTITAIVTYGLRLPLTVGVLIGSVTVFVVASMGRQRILERFENDSSSEEAAERKKTDPEAHASDPHLDMGTTILHAYRKLDPEQVVQMRKDTQELMDTQKNLIETLASLGPQVQQGAELVETFKKTFGVQLGESA